MFGVNITNRFGIFEDDDGKDMTELVEIQKNEQILQKKAAELAEKAKLKQEEEEKKAQELKKKASDKSSNDNDRPERNHQQRNIRGDRGDRDDRRRPAGNGTRGPRRDQAYNREGERPYRGDRREGGPEVDERRRPAGGAENERRRRPVNGEKFANRRLPARELQNDRRRRPIQGPENEGPRREPVAEVPVESAVEGEEPRAVEGDLKGQRQQPRRNYGRNMNFKRTDKEQTDKDVPAGPENANVENKDRPEDISPEEPKELTLGEYKAKLEQRVKPVFNVRKAGEGILEKWDEMIVLQRPKDTDQPQEDLKYDAAAFPQRAGKQKLITDVGFRISNDRRPAGVSGRGRPRANRRNEAGRDLPQRAAPPAPKVHDELDFPSLK